MVESVLTLDGEKMGLAEMLQPDPLADGSEPEQRIVVCGISWNRYLALDEKLGHDRAGPRLYYLDGGLELMTTSKEHERLKKWIGGFVEDYLLETGMETTPRGQATMRLAMKRAGAEPDESWCLGQEREFPDLVLEIALTSGGVNKLEIYRRCKVPEVWVWRVDRVEIFGLDDSGNYEPLPKSRLLPDLSISTLKHCVAIRSWKEARRTFRAILSNAK